MCMTYAQLLMSYTGTNGAADAESESVASASDYWKEGLAPDSIDGNALFNAPMECGDVDNIIHRTSYVSCRHV